MYTNKTIKSHKNFKANQESEYFIWIRLTIMSGAVKPGLSVG